MFIFTVNVISRRSNFTVLCYLKLGLNASHQHTIEEGHCSVGHNT